MVAALYTTGSLSFLTLAFQGDSAAFCWQCLTWLKDYMIICLRLFSSGRSDFRTVAEYCLPRLS